MYDNNPLTLLNLRRLPARVDYQGASVLLHFEPLAIKILVNLGHLKPLGNPQRHEHKYFSSSVLLKLAVDEKWLHEATRLLKKHWAQRNGRKAANVIRMQPPLLSPSDGPEQDFGTKGKKHDR
jgi:hypothetical protein